MNKRDELKYSLDSALESLKNIRDERIDKMESLISELSERSQINSKLIFGNTDMIKKINETCLTMIDSIKSLIDRVEKLEATKHSSSSLDFSN